MSLLGTCILITSKQNNVIYSGNEGQVELTWHLHDAKDFNSQHLPWMDSMNSLHIYLFDISSLFKFTRLIWGL